MAELKPTPGRVALLRAVRRGELTGYTASDDLDYEIYWDGPGGGRRVTARVMELRRAGWLEIAARHPVERTFSYRLTAAGEKVLEEADGHA